MSSKISSHDLADDLKQTIANAGSKHQMTVVTLSAAGWSEDSLTQTIAVEGISADETAQSISVSPYGSVENIAAAAGIYCVAQGENSLTFACEEIPSENVRFVVDWVDVEYIKTLNKDTDSEEILVKGLGYQYYEVGDLVTLNYSGNPTPFRVVHKNYRTQNKIVLVSENILTTSQWHSSANNYSSSTLRSYLNSTVLSNFSDEIQNAIVATNVDCHDNTAAVTCTDKIWALSYAEVGFGTHDYAPVEGTALDYFKDAASRIKYLNGAANTWWLRTPYTDSAYRAWYVGTGGSNGSIIVSNSFGVVPALEI